MKTYGIYPIDLVTLAERLGLPGGARILAVRMDPFEEIGTAQLLVEGDGLPPVALGERAPVVRLRAEWTW